ncbi:aminodeoxychorismate synthase [Sodalis-like endosymbiont of Proechinophthirus fluctus]|uniref:aminodeoxychorismate synthase component 1 n=1 Tax=Sodalis-like endosymbiont of Proechinophthirus fluctus TaxID=1462730 RepID=UPI0007A86FF5|nr:aminodeoxychorismate synthase component 1 [Sodalis-like endosymbiont of Proechinophthirus fluctus]KYP95666.1 aminodeoxychorismate synthase [Sodalis-like endosymbiont of Proechinophthirus fluctus]
MQPQLTALPYWPDAVLDYFTPLAGQPWAMLLHSGNSNHPDSRYDILVATPVVTLVTRDGVTEIRRGGEREIRYDDPFALVQQQLAGGGMSALPIASLPFLGGALGYFGYDLARGIETLPELAQQDVPLPEMAVGIYHWALIADHHLHTVTLVSYEDPAPLITKLTAAQLPTSTSFHLLGPWRANMTRTEYGEKFRQVQQHLLAGDCYQVCLAQRFSAPYNGDEWPAFRHLLAYNRAPFSAFIRLRDQAVMSLSPERFLRVRAGEIQARPIKGTLPRLADADADRQQAARLAASAKDKAENLMIVDLMRNDIGRVTQPGSVRVPSLFAIETFTAVHHMVSTITATLAADRTPCDLLRSCFPGGSITGAPKVRAMEIIEKLEPQRRSAWCGSIGYVSYCGAMDTNIAIRTLLVANQHIHCSVGGGLVADSNEEAEYQETLAKAASLLPLLEHLHT